MLLKNFASTITANVSLSKKIVSSQKKTFNVLKSSQLNFQLKNTNLRSFAAKSEKHEKHEKQVEVKEHKEETSKEQQIREQQELLAKKSDKEILKMIKDGELPAYALETKLGDSLRAIKLRREVLSLEDPRASAVSNLPYEHMDYTGVIGACAENVVGYIQIPVGTAGPLLLDGISYNIPMATTEGALIASTTRGCKAISKSGGASSVVTNNGMTRAPLLRFPNAKKAAELKEWLEKSENFYQVAAAFNSTSRYARLSSIKTVLAGRNVYMRFKAQTGDAMGMNMISKGVEKSLELLNDYFPEMDALSLSGNFCTDKKPSSINWTEGRGKSVVVDSVISGEVIKTLLKTTVKDLVEINVNKNLIGSAMAGSIGGFNAHASNIVTAIYLACGQDPAQNVESSNCITLLEETNGGKDLHASVTMPSIEVGTVGGGTHLPAQSACLSMLGIKGSSSVRPGANAELLARLVAATTLAGELSLLSALAAGHLVKSHIQHNRVKPKENIGDMGHSLAALKSGH